MLYYLTESIITIILIIIMTNRKPTQSTLPQNIKEKKKKKGKKYQKDVPTPSPKEHHYDPNT